MDFINLSSEKLFVLALLGVVLFGDRLPEMARTAAKFYRKLHKVTRELQDTFRLDD